MRVSIGPPISVMEAGRSGSSSSAMIAAATITGTLGWQTATVCARRPPPAMRSTLRKARTSST